MKMTRSCNTDAILKWCKEQRPDITASMRRIIEEANPAYVLMLTTAFEAGRMFQTTVTSPTSYEPNDEPYNIPRPGRTLDDLLAGT